MRAVYSAHRWRVLVGVLLVGLLLCGVATVARFHVWAEVDERHHYAYVEEVAEHGRLPRIDDTVSWQAWAIGGPTWPRPKPVAPVQAGAVAESYEAWQPPLYYVIAAPAFLVVGDHRDKVFVLRAFDLVLVLVAAGLLWRLALRALPEAPPVAFAGGVVVLLWPGVLVRAVTVSNTPLELVLTTAVLLALERAWARRDGRWLVAAGLLVGAALLTKVALVFLLPGLMVVAFALRRAAPVAAVGALAAPAAMLAPWLAVNASRYGALTANAASQRQLEPIVYPGGARPGPGALPHRLAELADGVLPLEWKGQLDVPWIRAATVLLFAALLAGGLAAALQDRTPLPRLTILAATAFLAIFAYGQVSERWDVLLLRHAYPLLPALGLTATAWLWRRTGDRIALAAILGGLLLLGALWVDMAGRFYFTDLGARVGI
jgi:4-amino-4-deoxy-L-arabinose transferase-like glycosyltransferase